LRSRRSREKFLRRPRRTVEAGALQRDCVRTPQLGLVNAGDERILTCGMREHPEPRPRDDKDAAQDTTRDLAETAGQLASLEGEARAGLHDPNYDTLKLRLEVARSAAEAAAVEARRRLRLNEGL
jgi:hypothetical protein